MKNINPSEHLSKKDLARKFRHEAYLRAKEFRRIDPRQIALKEQQKEFQREAYQEAEPEARTAVDDCETGPQGHEAGSGMSTRGIRLTARRLKKPGMNGPARKKRSGRIS
jgi:hypothetical protein